MKTRKNNAIIIFLTYSENKLLIRGTFIIRGLQLELTDGLLSLLEKQINKCASDKCYKCASDKSNKVFNINDNSKQLSNY